MLAAGTIAYLEEYADVNAAFNKKDDGDVNKISNENIVEKNGQYLSRASMQ